MSQHNTSQDSHLQAWNDIEHRCRTTLTRAGISVVSAERCISTAPLGCSYFLIHLATRDRWPAAKVPTQELAPTLVVRYHTHWRSTPLNAVYIFMAVRAWPDWVFRQYDDYGKEGCTDRLKRRRRT